MTSEPNQNSTSFTKTMPVLATKKTKNSLFHKALNTLVYVAGLAAIAFCTYIIFLEIQA